MNITSLVIFRFLLKRHCELTLAEEITAQTFLKAITNIKSFHYREGGFSSWLYKIALNESNSYYRKNKKHKVILLDETIASQLMDEVSSNYSDQTEQELATAISKLNKNQLELIQLRFYENMSFRQIAEVLSITENNAKVRCYRIIDKIRLLMPGS
jgi:RNA polymerase sigma-70 factor (ECF subfamily)